MPAPAPAVQDAGSGSSSSRYRLRLQLQPQPCSPQFVAEKKVVKKFTFQITELVLFTELQEVSCIALPVLHLKGQNNFILHYC